MQKVTSSYFPGVNSADANSGIGESCYLSVSKCKWPLLKFPDFLFENEVNSGVQCWHFDNIILSNSSIIKFHEAEMQLIDATGETELLLP